MPLRRKDRKGNLTWYGKVTLSTGKTSEKRCESKREAQEWEVLARARAESFNETATVSLAFLIERHLDHVKTRLSDKSYKEKCTVFRHLFKEFKPEIKVDKVTYAKIEVFLDKISRTKSGHRANKYRIHLVRAYNWGIKALGLPQPNPWTVERYKEDKNPRYVPPEEDFWKIHQVADEDGRRLLIAYLHTAGRMREIFALEWADVDFEDQRIRLWTNKRKGGREFDWLPMTDELSSTLKVHRLKTGFQQYVFVNPDTGTKYKWYSHFMGRLCKQAGVRKFGFHAIRHLSASILDKAGVPLAAIQAILRHKSSHTTAGYLHSLGGTKIAVNAAFSRTDRGGVTAIKKA